MMESDLPSRRLNEYEAKLTDLEEAIADYVDGRLSRVAQALRDHRAEPVDIRGAFTDLARLHQLRDVVDQASSLRREAWAAGGLLRDRAKALTDRTARCIGFLIVCDSLVPGLVVSASEEAMRGDPTGQQAETTIRDLFGLQPRLRTGEQRLNGLFRLTRAITSNYTTYYKKPRRYFTVALKAESRRDFRARAIEDRDWFGSGLSLSLNGDEATIQVAETEVARRELEASMAAQIDLDRELENLAAMLPPPQRDLLRLLGQGLTWTDARRRLGLPQSMENALRNRLSRARKQRAAS